MNNENGQRPAFKELLQKYLEGRLTDDEADMLFRMLPEHERELDAGLVEDLQSGRFDGQTDAGQRRRMFARLPLPRRVSPLRWLPAAAAAVLLLTAGLWLWNTRQPAEVKLQAEKKAAPSAPSGNNAMLVLGNGEVIQLDSAGNGTLAQQGGSSVSKVRSGLLAYGPKDAAAAPVYHTVVTPRGGTYVVVLADGSKVWLNAASSIRFPTAFEGVRRVEVIGEAYFEVTKNPASPFEVLSKGTKVTVLGTKFNVKAYTDDPDARVTLLEGSVRFSAGKDSALLKPGEQGVSGPAEFNVAPTDVEVAMAWRNGIFHFDNQPLAAIMREIGRWYDVEVQYNGTAASRRFSGIMRRSAGIGDVLKFMQLAGVKCNMDGRKIIINQ